MVKDFLADFGYKEEEISFIFSNSYIDRIYPDKAFRYVQDRFSFLLSYGYTKEQIIQITLACPAIFVYRPFVFQERFQYFENVLHYSPSTILKMILFNPIILHFPVSSLEKKIKGMEELGYQKEETLKMWKMFPTLCNFSVEGIRNKISFFVALGYTNEEVHKMTVRFASIFPLKTDTIQQRLLDLQELGYTESEALSMSFHNPSLFTYNMKNIKDKISDLKELGYDSSMIRKITISFPQIFSLNIDGIREKVGYLRKINVEMLIESNPKNLMQSVDLTHARYSHLIEKVDIDVIKKNLFVGNQQFQRKFGISKEELLEKYPYSQDKVKAQQCNHRKIKKLGE